MAHQSPLISIPRKTTTDVDWAGQIRSVIAQTYQEDPNAYSEELSALSRCRQDAVRGASSDTTARDLLYKYFGQLEFLETRFAEIKVPFIWNDAFTAKPTTQTSLAFEKASIIHLLSAVESQIASSGSRADSDGIKRASQGSRKAAGMLLFINKNFLHAPSTDLSREVVDLLVGILAAQESEIFVEQLVEKAKGSGLISNIANRAANEYRSVVDAMKEFEGKGVLDRNWLNLLHIKAKHFESFAQYHRSFADAAAGKHGVQLVRLKLADTAAQEAQRLAKAFTYTFISAHTPTIPHDAATNLLEITKTHAALCAEAKVQAQKDNDLIYHEILPSEASLAQITSFKPEAPMQMQDIFAPPEMGKLIGPDIFAKLVPMAVHQAASIYSEEKAQLVRKVVEKVDMNEGEVRAGLDHLGFPGLVTEWRNIADGGDEEAEVEISSDLARLADDVKSSGSLESVVGSLERQRTSCERELRELLELIDNESRECERARAKHSPNFTQAPSGQQNGYWRETITANLAIVSSGAAEASKIVQQEQAIRPDIAFLARGREAIHKVAQDVAAKKQPAHQFSVGLSLLDLDDDYGHPPPKAGGLDDLEKAILNSAIYDANEMLGRLGKIRAERDDVLKDLKEKVQGDDISSLLIMNRRNQGVENQVIQGELEKFTPYHSRISAAIDASRSILQELEHLADKISRGKGLKERQRSQKDRNKRVRDWEKSLLEAGAQYNWIRSEAGKGSSTYDDIQTSLRHIEHDIRKFVSNRSSERNRMISDIETRSRLGSSPPPPPPSRQTPSRGLESQMAGMSLGYPSQTSTPSYSSPPPPPQPARPAGHSYSSSAYPPPPTPLSADPYARPTTNAYPAPPARPSNSPYPPPPPGRPAQSSLYPGPPGQSTAYHAPSPAQPATYHSPQPTQSTYHAPPPTGQPSSQYPYFPPSQPSWQQQGATSPDGYTASPPPPPPAPYQSYGAPPQQQYSAYPTPPPTQAPPNQAQYNGYQPPQGYNGYQPPQSGYPYR